MIARSVLTQHAYDIAHPTFRHCPLCARRGFHSVLYQLASLTHCPLHKKTALVERCPKCEHRLRYELNVLTLEHPYRCTECRHRLNPSLIDQLQAKRQPNDCPVAAFESIYLRFGVPLLGYPGKRRMDDYTPHFAPKEILRALKDGKDTLNDDEWNALVKKIRPKSSIFTSRKTSNHWFHLQNGVNGAQKTIEFHLYFRQSSIFTSFYGSAERRRPWPLAFLIPAEYRTRNGYRKRSFDMAWPAPWNATEWCALAIQVPWVIKNRIREIRPNSPAQQGAHEQVIGNQCVY
jgi:hypothetical protein